MEGFSSRVEEIPTEKLIAIRKRSLAYDIQKRQKVFKFIHDNIDDLDISRDIKRELSILDNEKQKQAEEREKKMQLVDKVKSRVSRLHHNDTIKIAIYLWSEYCNSKVTRRYLTDKLRILQAKIVQATPTRIYATVYGISPHDNYLYHTMIRETYSTKETVERNRVKNGYQLVFNRKEDDETMYVYGNDDGFIVFDDSQLIGKKDIRDEREFNI
jgi:hypothetical protein